VINLVNPKSPFLENQEMMPPLGLMMLSAVIKREGFRCQIIDEGLGDQRPDGDLFFTGTTPQWNEMEKDAFKGYRVLGGSHASINPEEVLKTSRFSCVVAGEGEGVIKDILINKPVGIIQASRITDLDSLPFPDRTDAHRYHWLFEGRKTTTMVTSRGCTGKCAFCCRTLDRKIYFRSAKNVLEEIKEIRSLGFGAVMFYDDSIAMRKERLREICKGMEKMDMLWRCFIRSDQVNYELLQMMAMAGCREVLIGIESGSDTILKNIQKHETADMHKKAIADAKRAGIKVKALMIAGLPGETWETIEESKKFLAETRPDSMDVTVLQVYKGCPISANPQNYDLKFTEPTWYKGRKGEYASTVSTSAMSGEEIVKARDYLFF